MWCSEKTNVTKLDETIKVKGCFAGIPKKLRKVAKVKGIQSKSPCQKSRVRPVCGVSPRQAAVSPRKAAILKNAWQAVSDEDKENSSPVTVHHLQKPVATLKPRTEKTQLRNDKLKGELRVGFHMDGRILIVQVIEGKNFGSGETYNLGDSFYVTLSLLPVDDGKTREALSTRGVFDKSPLFNEEFTMELWEKDEKKRLVITVHRVNKMIDEVIGSLSFGISSLAQRCRKLSGWYYVLEENLGQKKHLRISQAEGLTRLINLTGVSGLSALEEQSQIKGFNGIPDVSVSPTVSEMMSSQQLSLRYPVKPAVRYPYTPMQRMNSTQKVQSPSQSVSELDSCSLSSISLCELTSSPGESAFRRNPVKFQNIEQVYKQAMGADESTIHENSTMQEGEDSSLKWTMHSTDYESSSNESRRLISMEKECWQIVAELDEQRSEQSCTQEVSITYNTMTTFNSMSVTIASAKDDSDYIQPNGCERLVEAEYEFLTKMQAGVQCFSRPLRYCMLTPHEHKSLFQNSEKIMAVAEFHLKKLSESLQRSLETGESPASGISSVYMPQISLMTEAYTSYISGLQTAKHLLSSLSAESEFQHFIQKSTKGQSIVTIEAFLDAPRKHLRELIASFEDILSEVSAHDVEYKSLQQILSGLTNCWEMSNVHCEQQNANNTYGLLLETHEAKQRKLNHRKTISAPSLVNVDSELQLLQDRLEFAAHVEPFQLAVPGRHIVYSGELCFVDGWKWAKAWVVLMNDVMIIAEDATTDRVLVIAEPIYMADVLSAEFNCMHPSEFILSMEDESADHRSGMRSVTFRASHPDVKTTWCHLLEQRVSHCHHQREYSL